MLFHFFIVRLCVLENLLGLYHFVPLVFFSLDSILVFLRHTPQVRILVGFGSGERVSIIKTRVTIRHMVRQSWNFLRLLVLARHEY